MIHVYIDFVSMKMIKIKRKIGRNDAKENITNIIKKQKIAIESKC